MAGHCLWPFRSAPFAKLEINYYDTVCVKVHWMTEEPETM